MMLPVRLESLFKKEAGNGNIKIWKSYMCYNQDRKKKIIYFLLLERSTTGELQILIFLTSFNFSGAS